MEPDDILTMRETWAAGCHADAPKGACCCCYRTRHHQHQVRTEAAEAEVARLTEQVRIAEAENDQLRAELAETRQWATEAGRERDALKAEMDRLREKSRRNHETFAAIAGAVKNDAANLESALMRWGQVQGE